MEHCPCRTTYLINNFAEWYMIFYTITWLLCAFSLVVDRDLLKDTHTQMASYPSIYHIYFVSCHTFFVLCDVICDLLQYTHTEKYNLFVKKTSDMIGMQDYTYFGVFSQRFQKQRDRYVRRNTAQTMIVFTTPKYTLGQRKLWKDIQNTPVSPK